MCKRKVFGDLHKFAVIAEPFTSYSNDITTIYGISISNDKVCIKVCNLHFQETGTDFIY